MPIVSDTGFSADAAPVAFVNLQAAESGGGDLPLALEITNDADPNAVARHFGQAELIAVAFPNFADGRGFSLARRLRALGYTGRLRAKGHVIADQYPMARACGFDEVEIDDRLAARQPEGDWVKLQDAAVNLPAHALRARP
jgi:uncharacterized protein (DUF934 family)